MTTRPTLSTSATSSSGPGNYEVVVSGASAPNYDISYTNGSLTISAPDPITVTAKSYSRVYGDANPSFGYDVSGGTLSGTPSITCEATATSPVGEYDIVVAQGSVTNGSVTYVKGKLTITKAPLNISAGTYSMKQGEALPTFSASYSGFKNGETEDVLTTKPTLSTSATPSSAPGTYDVVVSGASAQNYEINYTNGTLTITATTTEAITITAKSYSRVYGDANPSFGYDVSGGTLSGTPSITCSATSTSPVGEYDIVVAQGSVTNGNVTYVKGKLNITKAPLNISAGFYSMKQGESLPTFSASYSGFKNGETEDVLTTKPTLSTSATSSSVPGTYDVVVSGAAAQNYEISYTNGTLTITATTTETITITAKSYSRVYGDANPSFGYDVIGGTLSGTPSVTCSATSTSPVGEYDIVAAQGSVTNGNVTYVKGKLTITKAPLNISAGSYSMKQGEALPAFKASYSGFKNNETEDVLSTKPTLSTTATSSSAPGTYDVVASGASAQNYEISYTNGTLTITASSPSGTVVIDGIYYNLNNENHTAEVTFKPVKFDSGYIGYDAGYYSGNLTIPASVIYNSTTYSVTSIGECAFAESSIGSVQLPVGLLAIEDAAFSLCTSLREINIPSTVTRLGRDNFSIASDGPFKYCSSLTTLIIPASVTTFGPQSLAISDETTVIMESSTPPSIQDDYVILDGLGFPAIKKFVVPNGSKSAYQSANIWKLVKDLIFEMDEVYGASDPITVTAKSYSRVYGEANPSFGYDVSGGSLSGTPSITCSATSTSPVGEYDIVVAQGSVTNGNVTYVKGKLTITKAPLNISAGSYSMKQGEALPTFKASYSGFKNNETEDVLSIKPTLSTTATSSSAPGTYDVVVSGAAAQNYEISYTKGTLTITAPAPIIVTAKSYSRVYGDANPSFGYDVTGGTLSGTPSITCSATATSPVGEYDIVVAQGSVTNTNVTYIKGKLTITKAPLTISAGTYNMKQGESLPAFKASYSGFKNNETEDVLTTKPTLNTTATSSSAPGTYEVVASGAKAQNYDISYTKGILIVTDGNVGSVVVVAKSYSRVYGDANPSFEYDVVGGTLSGKPSITCEATATSPVGEYDIVVAKGSVTNNNVTYVKGKLTITKAALNISAGTYSMKQGEALPTFKASYSGFKNNETEDVLTTKPTFTTVATTNSEPGTYDVTVFGAVATNYDISYTKGVLLITEAEAEEPKVLSPIENETTMITSSLSGQDLINNVINGVYYNLGSDGYDSSDQSIVFGQMTNMSAISDKTPGSSDVKNNFHGIIMAVNGKGIIKVSTQSFGSAKLAVMVGNATPKTESHTTQSDMVLEYDVDNSTNVYIYAVGSSNSTRANPMNGVKIYSINITPNTTGIEKPCADTFNEDAWYTLDGRKLDGKPSRKGLYIKNGRKIIVK